MAKKYDIWFPLLSDEDLAMAKKYAGLGPQGYARPSLYLLDGDGRVLYQRIGENKSDRLTAQALLDVIDEKLHLADMPDAAEYVFPTRWQVAAALGADRRDDATAFAGSVDAALLRAIGSRLEVGLELGVGALPEIEARGAALLRLRQPIQRGLAEAYLQVPVGAAMSVGDEGALRLRTGAWLGFKARLTPGSYVFAELGADLLRPVDESDSQATQGLLRLGYGWAR